MKYTIVLLDFQTMSFNYTRCLGLFERKESAFEYLKELMNDSKNEFSLLNPHIYQKDDMFTLRDEDENVILEAFITVIEE